MKTMAVVIAMLRGVNVGGSQKLNMKALVALCGGLGYRDTQTYINSGNVVFREDSGDPLALARKLEDGLEHTFGFRPAVVVRTPPELRKVIARNPFAGRPDINPSRLLVVFMTNAPARQARDQVLALPCEPEELHIIGRELYIHYPDGMARPKIPMVRIEKMLRCVSTGRNWNTINKLLAIADSLEGQP